MGLLRDDIGDEWASDVRAADGSARGSYSRDRPALPPASDKAYRPPGTPPPPPHPPLPVQRERENAKQPVLGCRPAIW